jgi:peptidoglycan-associated lipoprotein
MKNTNKVILMALLSADLLSQTQVYFAYDSSDLDAESQAIAEAHASYLSNNPSTKVVLEGHADERGTREYNLALGERRAQSVADVLIALGVSAANIENVSYGEENPVAEGHDESSWRLNRRVEIRYDR